MLQDLSLLFVLIVWFYSCCCTYVLGHATPQFQHLSGPQGTKHLRAYALANSCVIRFYCRQQNLTLGGYRKKVNIDFTYPQTIALLDQLKNKEALNLTTLALRLGCKQALFFSCFLN